MQKEDIVKLIEIEIQKTIENVKERDEYVVGIIDGLIKAIQILG